MNLVITNRELLRNYKALKNKLLQKKVDMIEVKLDEDHMLEIKLRKRKRAKTPFERLLEDIQKHPIKGIKRPEADLFDYI
jgi:hypothetical protein